MKKKETFESAMTRLEEIVASLEEGDLTLEQSIALYDEGMKLSGFCSGVLGNAEQRITELSEAAQKEGEE